MIQALDLYFPRAEPQGRPGPPRESRCQIDISFGTNRLFHIDLMVINVDSCWVAQSWFKAAWWTWKILNSKLLLSLTIPCHAQLTIKIWSLWLVVSKIGQITVKKVHWIHWTWKVGSHWKPWKKWGVGSKVATLKRVCQNIISDWDSGFCGELGMRSPPIAPQMWHVRGQINVPVSHYSGVLPKSG